MGKVDDRDARIAELEAEVDRLTREIDDGNDIAQELMRERDEAREALAELREWATRYGKALCPTGADTYGEGMRNAKKQVRTILDREEKEAGR